MSMRVIAGIGKGRKLFSPPSITRPTSDRAREGLFSSLISTFGTLEGLHFLDLFAGSGAVGVEALSRGAALVEAVESNSGSADVCEENFRTLSEAALSGGVTSVVTMPNTMPVIDNGSILDFTKLSQAGLGFAKGAVIISM